MRLILAALGMVLLLGSTALAQPAGPDPVAPAPPPVNTIDLRAPDQTAPAAPTSNVATPVVDDGPAAITFVLIGLGAALVLLAGGYFGVRLRRRVAIADDLVTD
jgi:hypothetical protein